MSGFLIQVGASAICPHGGQVSIVSTNTRVKLGGQPATTMSDTFSIAGCAFTIPIVPPKPQPCVLVKWMTPASRIMIGGKPAILQDSVGLCQSAEQIPQGPPNVIMTQTRVKGS